MIWKENSSFVFHLHRYHPSPVCFIDSLLYSCPDSTPSDYRSPVLTGIKYCQQGWGQTLPPGSQLHRGHGRRQHQSRCVSQRRHRHPSSDWGAPFLVPACWLFTCVLAAQSCPTLVTPQAVARQTPLSMGFSRQEYWSGLPFTTWAGAGFCGRFLLHLLRRSCVFSPLVC